MDLNLSNQCMVSEDELFFQRILRKKDTQKKRRAIENMFTGRRRSVRVSHQARTGKNNSQPAYDSLMVVKQYITKGWPIANNIEGATMIYNRYNWKKD
jgi:hypothetical protein